MPTTPVRSLRARVLATGALLSLASGAVIATGTTAAAAPDGLSPTAVQPVVSVGTAASADSLDAVVAAPVLDTAPQVSAPLDWTLSGPGTTVTDPTAPGGSSAQLWDVGTARTTVTGAGQVVVYARADLCDGRPPTMAVIVDGQRAGWLEVRNTAAITDWWAYRLGDFDNADRAHRVVVQYAYAPSTASDCRPTLHVGGVGFEAAPADPSAQLWSIEGNGVWFSDLSTPGHGQAHLWSAGTTASTRVSGGGTLTIYARADACQGNPQMDVFVDGVWMGRQTVVNAFDWWSYPVGQAVDVDDHEVTVRYVADVRTAVCDRNLRVGGAAFSDTAAPAPGRS